MDDFDDPYFWRFKRTKPRKVSGGIKAQVKKFGSQWWAVRWLEAIEKFGPQKRVARGRSYARKGQIVDLQFEPGRISASVQGSREQPYTVAIFLDTMHEELQPDLIQELRQRPIFAATILGGELHPDIEQLFRKYKVSIFPTREEGNRSVCSCPDNQNPCKHIAAVYYTISLELERDPFLLLYLRGIPKDRIFISRQDLFRAEKTEPLPTEPSQFWKTPRLPNMDLMDPESASLNERPAVLRRLGSFPFWRGDQDFLKTLEQFYMSAKNRQKPQIE